MQQKELNPKYTRFQMASAAVLMAAVSFAAFAGFSMLRNLTVHAAGPIAGSVVYLLLVPVVYAIVVQFHRRINALDRYRLGMGLRNTLKTATAGFFGGAAMVVIALLLVSLALVLFSEDIDLDINIRVYSTIGFLLLSMVTSAWEELVFRGLIFVSLLKMDQRRYHAALISSTLFVLPHIYLGNAQYPGISLVGVFIFGVLLAHVYAYSGQIGWAIGVHAGWNFFAAGLDNLVVSAHGAEAPIGETPQMFSELIQVAVVLCVFAVYMYRKRMVTKSALESSLHGYRQPQ